MKTEIKKRRLSNFLRKRGWNYRVPRNGLRRRIYDIISSRYPWWDWGHYLMIVVGRDEGGTWSEPRPNTWWYRQTEAKRMIRTGYPIHPPSTYEVIKDYDKFMKKTKGLNENQMYKWNAICFNQDGELHLGHQYWGGRFFGLSQDDIFLLRRYFRAWRRLDWFGLRSWLFKQALHAAVYRKKPGACNRAPEPGSGGYNHWLCQLRRGHDGLHRYESYSWGVIDGETIGAFNPKDKESA